MNTAESDEFDPPASELQSPVRRWRPRADSTQFRRIQLNLVVVVAVNLLALLTGPILARALGPVDRGVLAAALLWPQLVNLLFTLGVGDSVTYFASRGDVNPRAVFHTARRLWFFQSLCTWSVGAPVVYLTMHHFGSAAVVSALLFLLVVPASVYAVYQMYFLNGLHRYGWFNIVQLQPFLFTALAYLALFLLGSLTVRTAIIATDISVLSSVPIGFFGIHRSLRGVPLVQGEPGLARRMLAYGVRSWATNVPHLLNDRVDQLVISLVLSARQLGWYAIAATIATAPAFVGQAVSNSVLPTVASLGTRAEQAHVIRRSLLLTFVMTLGASLAVLAVVSPLIRIVFGDAFLGGAPSARVLAVAAVMLSLTRAFHGALKGLGRPFDAAISEAGALAVTAVGLGTLVPLLGIMGAALTSVAAYTTSTLIAARLTSKALGISPFELVYARPATSAGG